MHCSDLWLITNLCPLCRPFSVTQIPHTNLDLIVADKMCPCYSARISVSPVKVSSHHITVARIILTIYYVTGGLWAKERDYIL